MQHCYKSRYGLNETVYFWLFGDCETFPSICPARGRYLVLTLRIFVRPEGQYLGVYPPCHTGMSLRWPFAWHPHPSRGSQELQVKIKRTYSKNMSNILQQHLLFDDMHYHLHIFHVLYICTHCQLLAWLFVWACTSALAPVFTLPSRSRQLALANSSSTNR